MRQATFGTDIRGRAAVDPATGYPWPPESAVVISARSAQSALLVVAPTARVIDDVIIARMSVTNPTNQVVSIVVNPYGGAFPYGGDTPFTLRFGSSAPVTYAGKLYPPAPPVPIHIDFPPQTEVTFEATIKLSPWAWSGNPTVPLDWGFHFASGKTPSGNLSVQLPLK
jgi:hypothetical protein